MHPFKNAASVRHDNGYPQKQYSDSPNKHKNNHSQNNHQNSNRHPRKKDFTTSYYAYGKSAAIEFSCDETKKQRIHTITLHAATARVGEDRGYDWENKTVIQMPRHELLVVASILLGLRQKGEFKQSGLHVAKSYSIEHQGGKMFFMVMERGKPIRAVGLTPEDCYQVTALLLKQLKQNAPWMTVSEIVQLIELTVVRMKSGEVVAAEVADVDEADEDNEGGDSDGQEEFLVAEEAGEVEPNFNV